MRGATVRDWTLTVHQTVFFKHEVTLSRRQLAEGAAGRTQDLTLPVAVEPVKEILATSGSVQRTSPTAGVFSLEQGTTFMTPAGIPACSASCTTPHHNVQTLGEVTEKPGN